MCLIRNCHCLPRDSDCTTQSKQPGQVQDQEEEEKNEEGEYEEKYEEGEYEEKYEEGEYEEKNEEGEYEVERIVAKRFKKGRAEYQVKWKNCPESTNTWEPELNLDCTEVLNAYENNLKIGIKTYRDEKKAQSVQTTTIVLLKWRGSEEMDLIPAKAKEANVKIPQVVISSESELQIEIGNEHSKNNVSEEQKTNRQMKRLREMLKKQTKKRKFKKN